MKIKPVWISSIEHLNQFNIISENGGNAKDITSRVPESFPYIKAQFYKFPIVFFSEGEIELKENMLNYTAKKFRGFSKNCRNLNDSLVFSIKYSDINNIARYYTTTYNDNYSIHWIRIMHSSENIYNNVLISFGNTGLFAMNRTMRNNEKLVSILKEKIS